MKKIFFFALTLATTSLTLVHAANDESKLVTTKKSAYHVPFSKIQVADGINLELTENINNDISFVGKASDISKVNWEIKNGVLYINSHKGSLKNKVLLQLSVHQLEEIAVTGSSNVTSINELNSTALKIRMDGNGKVAIKNTGTISVSNDEDIQLDIRKKTGDVHIAQ
jgi:hypothetical protein